MNCEDSRVYLSAYLDDELDVAENLRVQQHLTGCDECRRSHDEQLALRTALRDPSLYAHPSPEFANRMEALVRHAAKQEAASRSWPRLGSFGFGWFLGWFQWIPVAAALVIVAALGGWLAIGKARSHQDLLAQAVLAGHIRALQANHLVDVPSSDRHTVKPWFQGKLDFSPPAPDLSELGWQMLGGRLDYLDGHPVAALVYKRREHNINVFLWPNRGAADATIKEEDAQGYQILHWNGADMTYWVVSDLNAVELADFARALRGH